MWQWVPHCVLNFEFFEFQESVWVHWYPDLCVTSSCWVPFALVSNKLMLTSRQSIQNVVPHKPMCWLGHSSGHQLTQLVLHWANRVQLATAGSSAARSAASARAGLPPAYARGDVSESTTHTWTARETSSPADHGDPYVTPSGNMAWTWY